MVASPEAGAQNRYRFHWVLRQQFEHIFADFTIYLLNGPLPQVVDLTVIKLVFLSLLLCHLLDMLGFLLQDIEGALDLVDFVIQLVHLVLDLEEDLLILVFNLELEVFGALRQTRVVLVEYLLEERCIEGVCGAPKAQGTREITRHFEVGIGNLPEVVGFEL